MFNILSEIGARSIIESPRPEGQYKTHNNDGTFKQYRGSGKPHGGIPRPNVKENQVNETPKGLTLPQSLIQMGLLFTVFF
jgi:hypothetical protein